jgi:hypothetical protein
MLYRFKSRATGDTIMTAPVGDALLRAIGREPAARGILEIEAMPAALVAIREAIEADAQARDSEAAENAPAAGRDPVALRQRLWPMVQMIERALAAREAIVWGV